jgi:hypothetical protein
MNYRTTAGVFRVAGLARALPAVARVGAGRRFDGGAGGGMFS